MGKIIKISILSVFIVCLVGFMILFMNKGINFNFVHNSKLIYDKEYLIDEINNFKLDLKSEDVSILKSEDDKIRVKIYAKNEKVINVDINDQKDMIIKQVKKNVCVGFCIYNNNMVKIYLPEKYTGKFDLKLTSGDVKSTINNDLDYNIYLTSGDIEIKNAHSLVGKATSGDVEIKNLNHYIDFKTTSGDIEIDKFTIGKNSSIKVTSGDIDIDNISDAYITTSVRSGDVRIKKQNRYADNLIST